MTEDSRTETQRRAQLAALEKRVEAQGAVTALAAPRRTKRATQPESKSSLNLFHVPLTRRASFAMWLAPAILLAPALKKAKRLVKKVKRHVVA